MDVFYRYRSAFGEWVLYIGTDTSTRRICTVPTESTARSMCTCLNKANEIELGVLFDNSSAILMGDIE